MPREATLAEVRGNARLVTGDAVAEITRLKAEDGAPMDIGGGGLAGAAMPAGLIDEHPFMTHPVAGRRLTPFFTTLDGWADLRLAGTRAFPDGMLHGARTVRRYKPTRWPQR